MNKFKILLENRIYLFLFSIVILFFFGNCVIAFRDGLVEKKDYKGLSQINKSISYSMSYFYYINDGNISNKKDTYSGKKKKESWINRINKISFKLFSNVSFNSKESEYVIEFEITDKLEASVSSYLSNFTIGIIPGYMQEHTIIKAIFKDKLGNTLGIIEVQEKYTSWQQLLLIFIIPKNYLLVVNDIKDDLIYAAILEGINKGFIKN